MSMLKELESRAAAGELFAPAEIARVLACPDLVSVGTLGEAARRFAHGDVVTYGQVLVVDAATPPSDRGQAGEVRITVTPESIDAACELVRTAASVAGPVPVTGFSAVDLLQLVGGDHIAFAEAAKRLRDAGLTGLAFFPIDRLEDAAELVRALTHGGLQVLRATIDRADSIEERVSCIARVAELQRETSVLRAFAPLPRFDNPDVPSTGYDDVKTIAVARLACPHVPSIQVDWGTYGPKLAQVAIAYGADDIDNVPAIDPLDLGPRRSPAIDIARQITAAFATPAARDGRFERVT